MRVTGGLVGCASTQPGLPADVSDIYFTNAEVGPGKQIYHAGTPRQIQPEVHTFDRARDSKVTLVIVLTRGYAHEIHLAPDHAGGQATPG
jgi:hypothetical protein